MKIFSRCAFQSSNVSVEDLRNPKCLISAIVSFTKSQTSRGFCILVFEIGRRGEPLSISKHISYLGFYMHRHTHPPLKERLKHSFQPQTWNNSNLGQHRAKSLSCCQVSFPTYEDLFTDATISKFGGWRSAATSQDMLSNPHRFALPFPQLPRESLVFYPVFAFCVSSLSDLWNHKLYSVHVCV